MFPEQFGFRNKYNTELHLVRIIQKTIKFGNNKVTIMTVINLEKAHDTAWKDRLIHKLYKQKF